MAARCGRKISDPRHKPQRAQVYLLIAALGIVHRFARFGECRRIEDYKIIGLIALRLKLRQQVKHIGCDEIHAL